MGELLQIQEGSLVQFERGINHDGSPDIASGKIGKEITDTEAQIMFNDRGRIAAKMIKRDKIIEVTSYKPKTNASDDSDV